MTEDNSSHPAIYDQQNPWDRTLQQMWDMFFAPEIERRKANSGSPDNFSIYIAQVIFPAEGATRPRILFNDEVEGEALLRAPRPIEKGGVIYATDLQQVESFDLPDALLDSGHFTIVRSGDGWRMFFNFLRGRAKAKDMLELAAQFLEASRSSQQNGHSGPAIDNLFSASELISKAELILHQSRATKSKRHATIASEINIWARLGNIDQAFVALFNKLSQQRPTARYGNKESRPPMPDQENFDLVQAMIERGLERIKKATEKEEVLESAKKAT